MVDLKTVEQLPVEAYAKSLEEGWTHCLLDVREPRELEICSMKHAVTIPMGQIPARLEEVPKDIPLVVMCHHGARSLQVATYLRNFRDQEIFNLKDGINAWAMDVDKSMKTY